jgi:hypothetical protein
MRNRPITCPAGEQQPIVLGAKVEFPAETCCACVISNLEVIQRKLEVAAASTNMARAA